MLPGDSSEGLVRPAESAGRHVGHPHTEAREARTALEEPLDATRFLLGRVKLGAILDHRDGGLVSPLRVAERRDTHADVNLAAALVDIALVESEPLELPRPQ
jgi:hypothetical protein